MVRKSGVTAEFEYDGLNRKVSTIYPDNTPTVSTDNDHEDTIYDLVGNPIKRIDCNNNNTTQDDWTIYAYDFRNRLDLVTYVDGDSGTTDRARDYVYDAAGQLLSVDESGSSNADVSYTYDALGRIQTETSVGVKHYYRYDLNGNRRYADYDYVSGTPSWDVEWTYDVMNRVATIVENGNTTTYHYDKDGHPVERIFPNFNPNTNPDVFERRVYDAMGRLKGIKISNNYSNYIYYEYDRVGNAKRSLMYFNDTSGVRHSAMKFWDYDDRNRLTMDNTQGIGTYQSYIYTWDKADNPETKKYYIGSTLTQNITYDCSNPLNQIESWTDSLSGKTVSYEYDDNGNRETKTVTISGNTDSVTTYNYDEDNRLVEVLVDSSLVSKFAYDYRSRRYYRETASEKNLCVFDGGLAIREYNVANRDTSLLSATPVVKYLRGPDLGGGVGGMVYSIRGSDRIYSHANNRGDVMERTSSNGSMTWFAVYEAYGTRVSGYESGSNPDRQMANTKDEEADIGLLNEGMRYRDLETGTFLTRDPIRYGDGPNMYCYVHCNPITHFDAFGLWSINGDGGLDFDGHLNIYDPSEMKDDDPEAGKLYDYNDMYDQLRIGAKYENDIYCGGKLVHWRDMFDAYLANQKILETSERDKYTRSAYESLKNDGYMSYKEAKQSESEIKKYGSVKNRAEHWNVRIVLNRISGLTATQAQRDGWSDPDDRKFQKNNNPGFFTLIGSKGGVYRNGFVLYSQPMSEYHGPNKGKGCYKWVNPDGREIVISAQGTLETRPQYMGTYNFASGAKHVDLDMNPYYKWGNVPADVNHPTEM